MRDVLWAGALAGANRWATIANSARIATRRSMGTRSRRTGQQGERFQRSGWESSRRYFSKPTSLKLLRLSQRKVPARTHTAPGPIGAIMSLRQRAEHFGDSLIMLSESDDRRD